jgi:hypothetical protein
MALIQTIRDEVERVLQRSSPILECESMIEAIEAFLVEGLHRSLSLWNVLSNLSEDLEANLLIKKSNIADEARGRAWLRYGLNTHTLSPSLELLITTYGVIQSAYIPNSIVTNESKFREFLDVILPLSAPEIVFDLPLAGEKSPNATSNASKEEKEKTRRSLQEMRKKANDDSEPSSPSQEHPPPPMQRLAVLPDSLLDKCDQTLVAKLRAAAPDSADYTYYYHLVLIGYHAQAEAAKQKSKPQSSEPKVQEPQVESEKKSLSPQNLAPSEREESITDRPTKHRIKFVTVEYAKPTSQAEKTRIIESQHSKCKGCLATLAQSQSMLRGTTWEGVHFCYYTGFMYCSECHTGGDQTATIPARMIHLWDFADYPVCRDAFSFLEVVWPQPIVCVSALNPSLFERVVALRIARQIRVQLQLFHEICKDCPAFQTSVSGMKPLLYHMETTEMYSLQDIFQFRKCAISSSRDSERPDVSALYFDEFINTLKNIRSTCIQHVVRMCRTGCYAKAAKSCGRCKSTEAIFTFDINNTVACPKCGILYHRTCYKAEPCRTCYPSSPNKRAPEVKKS